MSLQRRTQWALALVGSGRAALAALARRVLLSAGWWLAAALRRPRLQRRLPFTLRRWHLLLGSVLAYKLLRSGCTAVWSLLGSWGRREEKQRLQRALRFASSYSEWVKDAVALDEMSSRRCQAGSPKEVRSRRQLQQRAAVLAKLRESGDITGLSFALRLDYLRQAGSASTSALMEAAGHCPVLPAAVERYIEEVKRCLHHIASCPDMALEDRLAFLRELRHAYGRTGLVLSGGGSFGFWHFGVVRALLDANLLPRVVSGSSAGSIGASLLCTRTDEEVHALVADFPRTSGLDFFANNSNSALMRHLLSSGYIQDHGFFAGRLRKLLGDLTFLDAYQRSGRILSISVTAADTKEPSRLLNYLTAPNVLIWSAVACSSAFPFLFAPQDLLARDAAGNIVRFSEMGAAQSQRRWCDGSLEEDLPMRGLSQLFNVNFFLASQANPWIIGIVSLKNLLPLAMGRLLESEFKHRCQQLLAVWPNTRLLKMLSQPWEGDITVALPPTAFPLGKAAMNFTQDDIWEAMRHGQQAVWAKLPAIQAACAIEICIEELMQRIALQVRQQAKLERAAVQASQRRALAGGGMRGSLPSWLHMPSLGLPTVDSECSLAASARPESAASLYPAGQEAGTAAVAGSAHAWEGQPGALRGLRRHPSSSRSSSREGSGHAGSAARVALGIPVAALDGQAAAEAAAACGVQATAGQLAVAGVEVAAEALAELEPSTPTAQVVDEGAATEEGELFESPSQAWKDLVVLSGISAAAGGQGAGSLDSFAY